MPPKNASSTTALPEVRIGLIGNKGVGKRSLLGSLTFHIENGLSVKPRDRNHVLDNGTINSDIKRMKGTLKGASMSPVGVWEGVLITNLLLPDTTEDEMIPGQQLQQQQEDVEQTADTVKGSTKDRQRAEEADYAADVAKAYGDVESDREVETLKILPPKKKAVEGEFRFPIKVTYGLPHALAKVKDSDIRSFDGIAVAIDASTWDNEKTNIQMVLKCYSLESPSWAAIPKVIMLTKCDKVVTAATSIPRKTDTKRKSDNNADREGIPDDAASNVVELKRIKAELEAMLDETKAYASFPAHTRGSTGKGESTSMVFACSSETNANVDTAFHFLAAQVELSRNLPSNTACCCAIA